MYNSRESRELKYEEGEDDSSMKDSMYSKDDILAKNNMDRKDSYDLALDGNGGGAQYR